MPKLVTVDGHGRKEPTEPDLVVIEELAAKGYALSTIASGVQIDKELLRRWRRDHPAVQDAIDRGKAREHDKLVTKLLEMAEDGNIVAILFALKARHGYREGGEVDTGRTTVTINLPGAMSPAQFQHKDVIDNGN